MKAGEKGLDKDKQKPNLGGAESNRDKKEKVETKEVKDAEKTKVNTSIDEGKNLKSSVEANSATVNSNVNLNTSQVHETQNLAGKTELETSMTKIDKKEKAIIKSFQMDPSEVVPPQEVMSPKKINDSFARGYLLQKLSENFSKSDDELILKGVTFGIEDVTNKLREGIFANSIKFGSESKTVNEIIQHKENKNKKNIDEILRQQKIKEIQENKESIGNKIKTLEENMRLLELDGNLNLSKLDLNTSIKGEGVVDDNIRKSRIKEIKQTKEVLERKLQTLDEHVQKLMTEEENNISKKFNLKQFLDNFEKDKSDAANRAKKWEIEQKERIKHMMELEEKKKNKIKQKEQENLNQIKQKEKEREDAYYRNLDKRREKDKINHENLEKLKEEWKSRNSVTQEYRFQKYEKEFLEQQEKEKEEKKKEDLKWLEERRNLLKPINKEEINEFSKKVVEERQKKMFEKEKKRMLVLEEIQQKNENLPKSESVAYQKAVEEAKQQKENREKEKLDKIYKNMKIKQFSKVIKTELLPKIDEKKKKELEERIVELQNVAKIKKHKTKSKTRVLLKKPDPNKPNKYKWKLKLDCSEDSGRGISKGKSRSRSKSARSVDESRRKDLLNGDLIENNLKNRISKSRSGEKRKPLEKHPDYLTEMRIKKTQIIASKTMTTEEKSERDKKSDKKWQKMINNGKYSLMENVEQIKIKANMLEEQAKMKEKFLQLNGGAEKNPELGENVSNMLIDALKAKLTILESISKKK